MLFPLFKEQGTVNSPGVNYFLISLSFLAFEQGLEFYLSYRQRKVLQKKSPPEELLTQASLIDAQSQLKASNSQRTFEQTIKSKFNKSKNYNLDRNFFSFVSSGYGFITSLGSLLVGVTPFIWSWSKNVLMGTSLEGSELAASALMIVIGDIVSTVIGLPLSYYSTFVLEEKHEFNKTTQWTFWTDLVKNFFVGNLLSIPLMLGIVKLVRFGGEMFYLYVWTFILAFSVLMITIYPTLIMPLFNKYTPLEDSTLKEKINKLAQDLEFPLTKIYEVDGSKRSSHSNAYLYGFFKDKRIVLYDTLFKKPTKKDDDKEAKEKEEEELNLVCTDEEVVGILAHELGHWKRSHTLKGFVLQQGIALVILRVFSEFAHNEKLYGDFGFASMAGEYPVIIGLTLFSSMMTPLSNALGLAMNTLTRKYEYEADEFATRLGKVNELKSGLLKISISNLSSFDVDPIFHMFHHSHPTVLQRLRRMNEISAEMSKKSS